MTQFIYKFGSFTEKALKERKTSITTPISGVESLKKDLWNMFAALCPACQRSYLEAANKDFDLTNNYSFEIEFDICLECRQKLEKAKKK